MFKQTILKDEAETIAFGAKLATIVSPGNILYLQGDLGSGKTTFVRGILKGFGFKGTIKSPTYTLVEGYEFNWGSAYHFDLYRLTTPEELESMGIREYFDQNAVIIVEWPERGKGFLPLPDIEFLFKYSKDKREVELKPYSKAGEEILQKLAL